MSLELHSPEAETLPASPSPSSSHAALDQHRQMMMGSVAAMMAHEFNNLMTPVLARAQDALSRDDAASMKKTVTVTLAQTQRAVDIARRLLDLARGESPEMRNWNLRPLVDRAVEALVRPPGKDGVDFKVEIEPELCVKVSRPFFEQMLFNLLLNARQAVGERGGRIAVSARNGGPSVTIDVADNGPGFDAARRDEVVNPFLSRPESEQRPLEWREVGIGLSVCRMIARMHGGRLEALANEPRGCIMRIELPCEA